MSQQNCGVKKLLRRISVLLIEHMYRGGEIDFFFSFCVYVEELKDNPCMFNWLRVARASHTYLD